MEILATDTEQLIKDTAKKVFFTEGRLHATTQDIANAAGINRASIHYYFRSRQLLFNKVFVEANEEMHIKLDAVFNEQVGIRAKTKKFIEVFTEKSLKHPYLEMFIITEFNTSPEIKKLMAKPGNAMEMLQKLEKEIQDEVKAGHMKPTTPLHYILTLISLCAYPFLGSSIIKNIFNINDDAYNQLIIERQQVIMGLIFLDA